MKQRMEELRIDYTDLSHGYFTYELKIKVNFSLTERLTGLDRNFSYFHEVKI